MPKFVTPMPLVIFRQLKSPGFYPLGGVQGLYLRIRGASESYILRYQDTFENRRSMSLGLRRSMSLSEARVKATEIRARLSECQASFKLTPATVPSTCRGVGRTLKVPPK
jgi:hypothetical protein